MNFKSKLNSIFGFNKVKDAEGAEVWIVSWDARYGDYSSDTRRVAKAFLLEEDAEAFAQSLYYAQTLLQNTNSIHITIRKQE